MKLFLISQDVNNGWDTYDSAVVCAANEEDARMIYPNSYTHKEWDGKNGEYGAWTDSYNVNVLYLGEACIENIEDNIICASFNAG